VKGGEPCRGSLISIDVSVLLVVVVVVVVSDADADLSSLPVVVFDVASVCARRASPLLWLPFPLGRVCLDICPVLKGLEGRKADLLRLVAAVVVLMLEGEKADATAKQER
jgi:hypothetical protein